MKLNPNLKKKKLIVFDLDGTLTESKTSLTPAMSVLLVRLLATRRVAIIGGGRYQQFQKQFLRVFKCPKSLLANLFLFPTTSTAFYRYRKEWVQVYNHQLTKAQRSKIIRSIKQALKDVQFVSPTRVYGKTIEDRGTQVSYSALGQDTVKVLGTKKGVKAKAEWGALPWRKKIAERLEKLLPEFEVHRGGLSTIDVTQKGIDKAYGVRQISRRLKVPIKDMMFVGDALYPGGNDFAAKKTGVQCLQVSGPKDTARIISFLLKG